MRFHQGIHPCGGSTIQILANDFSAHLLLTALGRGCWHLFSDVETQDLCVAEQGSHSEGRAQSFPLLGLLYAPHTPNPCTPGTNVSQASLSPGGVPESPSDF